MDNIVPNNELTGSILADNFMIVPESGKIFWVVNKYTAKAGQEAGYVKRGGKSDGGGYRIICINRMKHRAHRLVWLWVHGEWPIGELDHINGNRDDNRISNLRQATVSQNRINRTIQSDNQTGFKWVSWLKQRNCWRARILSSRVPGQKRRYLLNSHHETPEAAYEAACIAAKKIHGEWYNPEIKV